MSQQVGLQVYSFNQRNTSVSQRDLISLSEQRAGEAMLRLREELDCEAAVLATCHRTELYLFGEPQRAGDWARLQELLRRVNQLDTQPLPAPDALRDEAAARHLFRVACSMESIALGENQILAQVKAAHDLLLQAPGKSPVLDRLFQFAIRAGKAVRTETGLCQGAVSISSVSVELARKIFGTFARSKVLLVGAGETAAEAAVYFQAAGAREFSVVNRGRQRGEELAQAFEGRYRPLNELEDACLQADIVVVATGSPDYLLTRDMLRAVMKARRSRPIFLIDISNPRNVDPRVARLGGVYLYNIDDLMAVVEANLNQRMGELPKAEAIVEALVDEWRSWVQTLRVKPTIATLARFFETLRQQELDRMRHKVSPQELELLESFSQGLTRKLLHNPIMHMRQAVDDNNLRSEDLDLIWDLFRLHDHINVSDDEDT